jgi:RNA polymerase sigma-70 factor (ECF subfamily)
LRASRTTICYHAPNRKEPKLSTPAELSEFLSSVERRAYKQALFAVRDEHAALDIVQEAMIKLAEKYGSKPAAELPLLFQRILQNTIRDHFRRQKVRSAWTTLFSSFTSQREDDEYDPLETLQDNESHARPATPDDSLQQNQVIALIEQALSRLPARQREAFLLRYWEGLDTAETAAAMGCTEGSVKTHCSRAVHALAVSLKTKGVELP